MAPLCSRVSILALQRFTLLQLRPSFRSGRTIGGRLGQTRKGVKPKVDNVRIALSHAEALTAESRGWSRARSGKAGIWRVERSDRKRMAPRIGLELATVSAAF
jgi:hypothetical protein